jgi:hypothetical protein
MLPPGFARLATMPALTGSATCVNTTGMVWVAVCIALTAGVVLTRMTSGDSATNSIAAFRKSLVCLRYSICTLRPSVHPNLCSSLRNASIRTFSGLSFGNG